MVNKVDSTRVVVVMPQVWWWSSSLTLKCTRLESSHKIEWEVPEVQPKSTKKIWPPGIKYLIPMTGCQYLEVGINISLRIKTDKKGKSDKQKLWTGLSIIQFVE